MRPDPLSHGCRTSVLLCALSQARGGFDSGEHALPRDASARPPKGGNLLPLAPAVKGGHGDLAEWQLKTPVLRPLRFRIRPRFTSASGPDQAESPASRTSSSPKRSSSRLWRAWDRDSLLSPHCFPAIGIQRHTGATPRYIVIRSHLGIGSPVRQGFIQSPLRVI